MGMNRGSARQTAGQAFLAVIATVLAAFGQQAGKLEFDAVSIKPADPSAVGRGGQQTAGGLRTRNLRLVELIMQAWRVNRDQIVGGPGWMEMAGWDIDARFPAGASVAQSPEMMKAMLADRFRLAVHEEMRTLPVYQLSLAKGGLKLKEGDGRGGMSAGPKLIRYGSATMADLASQLAGYLGRQVVDKIPASSQRYSGKFRHRSQPNYVVCFHSRGHRRDARRAHARRCRR
jgi:uncharacterized protein (TIGR03435 family)